VALAAALMILAGCSDSGSGVALVAEQCGLQVATDTSLPQAGMVMDGRDVIIMMKFDSISAPSDFIRQVDIGSVSDTELRQALYNVTLVVEVDGPRLLMQYKKGTSARSICASYQLVRAKARGVVIANVFNSQP
jgi:hypothetical protein